MRHTFNFDEDGRAISYNCGCIGEHHQYCGQVSEQMVGWYNSLPRVSAVRVAKRNMLLGVDAPVSKIATL